MNLAVIHYHLNRGGVTRVIENQLRALDAVLDPGNQWQVVIFYGGRREGWDEQISKQLRSIRCSLVEVPDLDYDSLRPNEPTSSRSNLGNVLRLAFERHGLGPSHTIVHVHNHALGKNRNLPAAVTQLAEAGFPMLLQIHDFAEDFRPENYRHLITGESAAGKQSPAGLYPQAQSIHYATLNSRDLKILAATGIATERLHLLPNVAPPIDDRPDRNTARRRLQQRFDVAADQRFLLYPVRCIRRKNIGEALLYAALAPAGTVIGLALPPLNPKAIPFYSAWKDCARQWDLPCRFEVGTAGGMSFAENLVAADAVITTSVAEGFGMVFLESWLAGRPLAGRDLPDITADFRRVGLRLDYMSPTLRVPLDWVGADRFHHMFASTYRLVLTAYGQQETSDIANAIDFKTRGGFVDFGDLDELLQQVVIDEVCQSRRRRESLLETNPWLQPALEIDAESTAETIAENARIIDRVYSLTAGGRTLFELYRQVHQTHTVNPTDTRCHRLVGTEEILQQFLDPRRFRLIRS